MALSLNPFSAALSSAKSAVSSVTNQFGGGFSGQSPGMAGLDETVNQLGGGIGSPLNGATAGGFESTGTALGGIAGGISNAAGDIGRAISSAGIGGAIGSIGSIAGAISSAAGQLNNVLSLFRGKNLPSSGELFEARGSFVELQPGNENDWRVRINANFSLFGGAFPRLSETNGVVWPYNPSISIATKANYSTLDPVHNNYPFQAYKNSSVEDITIAGDFSCETDADAAYWIEATTFFKSATKMFFGKSANAGNPPIICNLSGYGPGVLNSVPVIVKSFNVELAEDVNYIKCSSTNFGVTWVPIISKISVTVSPIYNRTRLRQFSLQQYANGDMSMKGYI